MGRPRKRRPWAPWSRREHPPGLQVSHAYATLAAVAAGISLMVVGLPVLLITLFGWLMTVDVYLACSAAFALIAYAEGGELP